MKKYILSLAILLLYCPGFALAAPNPCDTADCIAKLLTDEPDIGNFTSDSWDKACPTGASGLLQGCFINAHKAATSPVGPFINLLFTSLNTVASSVDNAVYIRRFPPGYVFTANSGKDVTWDATNVSSPTRLICVDTVLESGVDALDDISNDPSSPVPPFNEYLKSSPFINAGSTLIGDMLSRIPGGAVQKLNTNIYTVCVGINSNTGAPSSLVGFNAF